MNRWSSFGIGGATFAVVHLVQASMWRQWFDTPAAVAPAGTFSPWFLNSGRATTLVVLALFAVAIAIGGARSTSQASVQGCWMAAGAAVAMTIVLFAIGPGTIFPIVLAFGTLIALVSSVSGAVVGSFIRRR